MGNKGSIKHTWGGEKPQTTASNIIDDTMKYRKKKKKKTTKKADHKHIYEKTLFKRKEIFGKKDEYGQVEYVKLETPLFQVEDKCSICGREAPRKSIRGRLEGYALVDGDYWKVSVTYFRDDDPRSKKSYRPYILVGDYDQNNERCRKIMLNHKNDEVLMPVEKEEEEIFEKVFLYVPTTYELMKAFDWNTYLGKEQNV